MIRPRRNTVAWWIFGLASLLVIDGLAWATWQAAAVEKREATFQAQNERQQAARLAMWRMDATLATLFAREAAKPRTPTAGGPTATDPFIRLRSVLDSDADPTALERTLDTPILDSIDAARAADEYRAFRTLVEGTSRRSVIRGERKPAVMDRPIGSESKQTADAAARERLNRLAIPQQAATPQSNAQPGDQLEASLAARSARGDSGVVEAMEPYAVPDAMGPFRPVWLRKGDEPELALLRDITRGEARFQEAIWLDWPALEAELIASVVDVLPTVAIVPTETPGEGELPLALIPATLTVPPPPPVIIGLSPLRLALGLAWVAAITALAGVGFAMRSSARLAARRAAFVSAVAHELRTPLTAFRLHADLLASDRITDEQARRQTAVTVRDQAGRLARTVEDVLAAARGSSDDSAGRETLDAAAARATLDTICNGVAAIDWHADPSPPASIRGSAEALDRIARNLVENAAVHGAPPIRVVARLDAAGLRVTVHDAGPGFDKNLNTAKPKPFERGPDAAGRPGLGLGLWLASDTARRFGGSLTIERPPRSAAATPSDHSGAAVTFFLPAVAPGG